jgi:hypothetical protein
LISLFILIVILYRTNSRALRLKTEGRIVRGQIKSYSEKITEDGEGYRSYSVVLVFEFCASDHRRIVGRIVCILSASDYYWTQPPEPGTPVAVLYVNDGLYEML